MLVSRFKIAQSCVISIISLCFALRHQLIFALGNMVCTSKIQEYPSRDPAFFLESCHSLEPNVRKPSGYVINRYMERFLLRMPLMHSGPAPLPTIWNGSLYLKLFRFFTHAGCRFRSTHVWNASFRGILSYAICCPPPNKKRRQKSCPFKYISGWFKLKVSTLVSTSHKFRDNIHQGHAGMSFLGLTCSVPWIPSQHPQWVLYDIWHMYR